MPTTARPANVPGIPFALTPARWRALTQAAHTGQLQVGAPGVRHGQGILRRPDVDALVAAGLLTFDGSPFHWQALVTEQGRALFLTL